VDPRVLNLRLQQVRLRERQGLVANEGCYALTQAGYRERRQRKLLLLNVQDPAPWKREKPDGVREHARSKQHLG